MTVSLQIDSRSPSLAFAGIKQESYLPVGAADSVGRPAALNCGGREISKLPNETKHRDNKAHLDGSPSAALAARAPSFGS